MSESLRITEPSNAHLVYMNMLNVLGVNDPCDHECLVVMFLDFSEPRAITIRTPRLLVKEYGSSVWLPVGNLSLREGNILLGGRLLGKR